MPQYTYRCPTCHHTETRIVRIADRDDQTCEVKLVQDATITINSATICGQKMTRDEMEETAFTPYSWKP